MGSSSSSPLVEVTKADSVAAPGVTGILQTVPLDVDYDKFFDCLVQTFKEDWSKVPGCKEGEVKEFNGKVFDIIQKSEQPNGDERISKYTYRVDKEKGEIYEENRHFLMDILLSAGVTRVLKDPVRVEYWRQWVLGPPLPRRAGPVVQKETKTLLDFALGRDILVLESQDSMIPPGLGMKSCKTEPLDKDDGDLDVDKVFDALYKCMRTMKHNQYIKGEPVISEDLEMKDPNAGYQSLWRADAIVDTAKLKADGAMAAETPVSDDFPTIFYVRASKTPAFNGFLMQIHTENHVLIDICHYIIHKEPLQIESFSMSTIPPAGDEEAERIVGLAVSQAMQRAAAA